MHLRIGRLLATHTPAEKREEAIFEIVNQLNRGAALITSGDEREQLAELNLIAGQRAEATTAYASALTYLTTGAALLPKDSWELRQELTFALELRCGECEFLTGALAEAEKRLAALSSRPGIRWNELRPRVCGSFSPPSIRAAAPLQSVSIASAISVSTGRRIPRQRKRDGNTSASGCSSGSHHESLIDLPLMSDPASLATLDVLAKIGPPAFYTDANLLSLVTCRAVNLSLEGGNCDASCIAYEWLVHARRPALRRLSDRRYAALVSSAMAWSKDAA